jgi:delta24(24(1))-sterol reductase
MTVFPLLMLALYFAVKLHSGHILPLVRELIASPSSFGSLVMTHADPTNVYAYQIYLGYVLFSAVLATFMPGPKIQGLPLPSKNGARLDYICNGVSSFYATLVVSAVLHVTGVFPYGSPVVFFLHPSVLRLTLC